LTAQRGENLSAPSVEPDRLVLEDGRELRVAPDDLALLLSMAWRSVYPRKHLVMLQLLGAVRFFGVVEKVYDAAVLEEHPPALPYVGVSVRRCGDCPHEAEEPRTCLALRDGGVVVDLVACRDCVHVAKSVEGLCAKGPLGVVKICEEREEAPL
jgi:hypothetical protein